MADLTKIDVLNSKPVGYEMLAGMLGQDFSKASGIGEAAEDLQVKWLRLQSGYKPNEDVYSAVHEVESEGEEEKDKKRRTRTMRMARAMNNIDAFNYKGHNLTGDQFMESFEEVIDTLEKDAEKTQEKADTIARQAEEIVAEVEVTDDQILRGPNGQIIDDEFELQRCMRQFGPDAEFTGTLMTEETTKVGDVLVETVKLDEAKVALEEAATLEEEAAELEQEAAELAEKNTLLAEYAEKIASGEMKPDDLPPEYKDLVLAQHIENEQTLSTEPTEVAVAPIPEVLQEAQQYIATVVPALSPDPKP